jgi:hypothetical protein
MDERIGDYHQLSNAGGLRRLRLLPESAVVDVLDPVRFPNTLAYPTVPVGNLLLTDSTTTEFVLPPVPAGFSVTHSTTVYGDEFAVSILFRIPRQRAELVGWLSRNLGRRWIVLAEDRNGLISILGDVDNGLVLTTALATGDQATGQNSIGFELTGRISHAPWLAEQWTMFPEGAFDFSFDSSFDS